MTIDHINELKHEDLMLFAQFIDWTPEDAKNVAQVPWDKVADSVVPLFYQRISEIAALDRLVQSYTTYDRLQETLRDHIAHLSDDPLAADTVVRLRKTSAHHFNIGLGTEWFLGSYWKLFQTTIHEVMVEFLGQDHGLSIVDSVIKRLSLDILVMTSRQSTYYTFNDILTQTPNRLATQMQLDALIRVGQPFILLFADLNGFKLVNDTFGHNAGDQVLSVVAQRWRSLLRRKDWMGRWGGDEFVFLFSEESTQETVSAVITKLASVFDTSISIPTYGEAQISSSFGHAIYPEDGTTAAELLHHADQYLYEAKQSLCTWVQSSTHRKKALSPWTDRIQQALDAGKLEVHYQPIVPLHGQKTRWEALVRYRDHLGGLHYPHEFLAELQHKPILKSLDQHVLRQVFRDLNLWHLQGHPQEVSVNVTLRDIFDSDWLPFLQHLHEEYNFVLPTDITFEFRESMTVLDVERAISFLNRLREQGYGVSLDNFGTGFSSLTRLQRLPINTVKIDTSFTKQWQTDEGRTLIQAIIGLSRPMAFSVVAEGVETLEQRNALKDWGCDAIQGWVYSAAREAKEVPNWVTPALYD